MNRYFVSYAVRLTHQPSQVVLVGDDIFWSEGLGELEIDTLRFDIKQRIDRERHYDDLPWLCWSQHQVHLLCVSKL